MSDPTHNPSRGTRRKRVLIPPVAAVVLIALLSCRHESGTTVQDGPVAERTSLHYLLSPVTTAHDDVAEAEAMLRRDPPDIEAARISLSRARRSLANLEWFYVPATEARENVYNAYRDHLAGRFSARDTELETARRGLLGVAEKSSPELEPYVEELVQRIESVQLHARDGASIGEELKSLCNTFQLRLLKAPLALDKNSFDEPKTSNNNHPKEVDDVKQQQK